MKGLEFLTVFEMELGLGKNWRNPLRKGGGRNFTDKAFRVPGFMFQVLILKSIRSLAPKKNCSTTSAMVTRLKFSSHLEAVSGG